MKKNKIVPLKIETREAMLAEVARHIERKLHHAQATAAMEREKLNVEQRYQDVLNELSQEIEQSFASVKLWAESHGSEFLRAKSIDATCATIGFRMTPYRVEKRSARDTWAKIAVRLKSMFNMDYVRQPALEVDKEALLSARTALSEGQQRDAGIEFDRDELFFIDPKSDAAENTTSKMP
jgi:phage host-nuclease inhibitor protein Gam